eukprot:7659082-Ditylum_brightwellii.AAC.1
MELPCLTKKAPVWECHFTIRCSFAAPNTAITAHDANVAFISVFSSFDANGANTSIQHLKANFTGYTASINVWKQTPHICFA